ncbi:hypothetical protein N8Y98_02905 [Pelagibacterales bacterium]|nr:hypothetical protein [Pelagibacterales bacterium]
MALRGRGGRRSSSAADNSGSSNNTGSDNASSGNVTNTNVNTGVTTNVTNTNPNTGDTTNVTFGGPDPRGNLPTYNPNIIGAYFGYYNPDYAPSPSTITTPSAVGDVPSTPFPATEISGDVSSGYSPIGSNPSNNFFSGIGSGISNLASNFNIGNVVGSAIGNAIFPGIGGLLGGYIGNTYGDDDPSNNFFGNLGENLKTDFGDTVDFFSPDVKAIDPSLDTSGLTTADLTGSEITNTVDPVNEIGIGTLYGPSVTDISYQDPNALPDNPMYGPDDVQRTFPGSSSGMPSAEEMGYDFSPTSPYSYTAPEKPDSSVYGPGALPDSTNPSEMAAIDEAFNAYRLGLLGDPSFINPQPNALYHDYEQYNVNNPYTHLGNQYGTHTILGQDEPNTNPTQPGEMFTNFGMPIEMTNAQDFARQQAILKAKDTFLENTDEYANNNQIAASLLGTGLANAYINPAYSGQPRNILGMPVNPSSPNVAYTTEGFYHPYSDSITLKGLGFGDYNVDPDNYMSGPDDTEGRERFQQMQEYMDNYVLQDRADTLFHEGLHVNLNPRDSIEDGFDYTNDFIPGEETFVRDLMGQPSPLGLGYSDDETNLTDEGRRQLARQLGLEYNQGGLVPPTSGPMSNGIGVLYKNK